MTPSSRLKINSLGKNRTPFLFLISYDKKDVRAYPLPLNTEEILFSFPEMSNHSDKPTNKNLDISVLRNTFEAYKDQFEKVQELINRGEINQLNLTRATPIKMDQSLEEIYNAAKAPYKLFLRNKMTVFSPETFIKIEDGRIHTFPMKGTIDAAIPDAKRKILHDNKELNEHREVIDSVLENISQVAENVKVESYRYATKVRTNQRDIWQISSHISGKLSPDWNEHLGDLLDEILPAGSIAGVPRDKALQAIESVEDYERGFYTGVMGIFDGVKVDSAVMIRFIELTDSGFAYKSGGGITAQSNVHDEFNELINKIYVPIY